MEENNTNLSTSGRTSEPLEEKKEILDLEKNEELEDEEIIDVLKKINVDSQDILTLYNDLLKFNIYLKSLKNIKLLLTNENLDILKKLNAKEIVKISLVLSKIYMNIMNNDSLYSRYLVEIKDDEMNILFQIIEECISLCEKLNGFVIDPEVFKFKAKTLGFIKSFYYNSKSKMTNDIYIKKLIDLLDNAPYQFFSDTFNELNSDKEAFEIWKTEEQEKINNFEEKFAQINNYYEQFDSFRKFVRYNSGIITYESISCDNNEEKKEEEKKEIDPNKIDFYHQYGLLLLKFFKYHQYIFLNTENKDPQNEKKQNEEEKDNIKVVFLLDKIKQLGKETKEEVKKEEDTKDVDKKNETKDIENKEETKEETKEDVKEEIKEESKEVNKNNDQKESPKEQDNKKIENLMHEKLFNSVLESEEYRQLIKKEIEHYLEHTKSLEKDQKIKTVRDQMSYFLSILGDECYVPLYLTDFSKITISDNFTPSFLTNVPAGKINEFYIETKINETMLIYIEFSIEDTTKDITFEVNKYEINSNTFKQIYKEERIEGTFKLFILCNGYSLYQILFNNYYSWFSSKDINYRITLLKLVENSKKGLVINENESEDKKKENIIEEKEEEKNEKENKNEKKEDGEEGKFYYYFNGKNNCFNQNQINEKIKEYDNRRDSGELINIPVILYLNNLRIATMDKNEVKFIEKKDEENFIPKHFFDYTIINYIKKTLKIKPAEAKNKKIIISIFSQNRDLSTLYKEVEDQINALSVSTINNSINDSESLNYLQKIGFYPSEMIEGYNVEYRLYDLCEQSLIYYLYLSNLKNIIPKKSILFMLFDKLVVNAAIFNEGAIFTKLKGKKDKDSNWKSSYFNNINVNDVNGILDFLENANDTFEGIDLVLSYVDNNEEKKKNLFELFETIKNHCKEKINPPVEVFVCEQNEIADKVFNYINSFYNN